MTKEKKNEILAQKWNLWPIPKEAQCLFDKVIIEMARNPKEALAQNILDDNNNFWRNSYEQTARR